MSMFRCIDRIRGLGVFDSYDKPPGIKDFSDRNVIYGWNYSGKTTLSRLFAALEAKRLSDDFPSCKFSIARTGGATVAEDTLPASEAVVRVFNTDFVEQNIRWDGTSFNPILLLGEDSKDAQDKINRYERVVKRCVTSASAKRKAIADDQRQQSEAKTQAAKLIRTTLSITDPFNATHLERHLQIVEAGGGAHSLDQTRQSADLKLANTSSTDELPTLDQIRFSHKAVDLSARAADLFSSVPPSSQIIEHLTKNRALADWVGQGLGLHDGKSKCEFCAGPLTAERRAALDAHFSEDMRRLKADLEAFRDDLKAESIVIKELRESDFYAQFRERFPETRDALSTAVSSYNGWLRDVLARVEAKLGALHEPLPAPPNPAAVAASVDAAAERINALVKEHNTVAANFGQSKSEAVQRLKMHYAQEFMTEQRLSERKTSNERRETQAKRYDASGRAAREKIAELQAKIDKAQNGRSRINERIATLLGSDAIQIAVDGEPGAQRFRLTRRGKIAKRLSEGEKTAIAFAYFLTTLEAHAKFDELVVFIDDPISSLDSNHIFQVFSILKTMFFKWAEGANGKQTWLLTCRQIFISTHNFEFLTLLKDLRGSDDNPLRLYMTKRVDPARSTLVDLPAAIAKHNSEYHYLFGVLHAFNESDDKEGYEHLLAIPNAARRFLEMYTYARMPTGAKSMERRATMLFGKEETARIVKLLHHFSHLESIERLVSNTDLISDIAAVVSDILEFLRTKDEMHHRALVESLR